MKHKNKSITSLGIAACHFLIDAATDAVQLFPAGQFAAPEGALRGEGPWYLDEPIADSVMAALVDRDNILIDYDHQSLEFVKNLQTLEAAGTFAGSKLEWRDEVGLFATNVAWAATAKKHFSKGAYRYISPLFTYDKATGAVKNLISVAVTDTPAIKNMQAIELAAASLIPTPEEDDMNKELLALLKLKDDATDAEVLAACKTLQQAATSVETLTDEVAALKANVSAAPDPAKFVPVETMTALQNQVAALTNQINTDKCQDLIIAALSDGRLLPAQKSWAESLAIEALNAYLENAQPIAALSGTQTGGNAPDTIASSDDETTNLLAAAAKYQTEQAALGVTVDDVTAIAHVNKLEGKNV